MQSLNEDPWKHALFGFWLVPEAENLLMEK